MEQTKANILDGVAIAKALRGEIAAQVEIAAAAGKGRPCLAVVLVGEDPASVTYVAGKQRALSECGMKSRDIRLSASTTEAKILSLLDTLNEDPQVHGILVQLPLPEGMDEKRVTRRIVPEKDVDGLHPVNAGRLLLGDPEGMVPCTALGVLHLLQVAGVETAGKKAVVVGRSSLVGRPVSLLLSMIPRNATVTVCHSKTANLETECRSADILVSAAGVPALIRGNMVKSGAAVIDVGTSRVEDRTKAKGWRLAGDVDFEEVCRVASVISPVPGGVGPMTIAMLLHNTLRAAKMLMAR